MSATLSRIEFPRLYEPIHLEQVDDVMDTAVTRAQNEDNEGTLVWARSQTNPRGRCGHTLLTAEGGLHFSLVLRPDEPLAVTAQLALVGMVSLAEAVAEHVSPMTDLRYRWPNDLELGNGKVGAVELRAAGGHVPEWVVLGGYVNVEASPLDLGFDASSLHADGNSTAEPGEVLERFTRYFLSWVNRWADEGLAPIRESWLARGPQPGNPLAVSLPASAVEGHLREIDAEGAAVLDMDRAGHRRITLAEAFGLEPSPTTADRSL